MINVALVSAVIMGDVPLEGGTTGEAVKWVMPALMITGVVEI